MTDQQGIARRDLEGAFSAASRALDRARLEYVFLVVALFWGVAQVFLMPPLQVPDEGDHWFRAWAMTDGQFTADKQGMLTLPGVFARTVDIYTGLVSDSTILPPSLEGQPGFSGYEDMFDGPGPPDTVRIVSRVANYGPIGYLPQAAGIAVGRLIGAPPLICFYLARLANLLAAVTLLFFAIRLAPFGKQLFVLIALLPVTMMELASISSDALTIAGAVFFISLVLWASTRATLRRMDVALLLASGAVFLNVKPGYWALILLLLLVRPRQLGSRERYVGFVAAGVFLVIGVQVVDSLITRSSLASGGVNTQLSFILQQPMDFLGIMWSNLPDSVFRSAASIGILGWMSVALPPVFYAIVIPAAFVFFFWMGEDVHLEVWRRALLAAVAIAIYATIAIALYGFLEPIGSRQIIFQGRYLVPVWLLLLLSAYGFRLVQRHRAAPFLAGLLVFMMVVNLGTIVSSYYL
jgi:hypothetical protein